MEAWFKGIMSSIVTVSFRPTSGLSQPSTHAVLGKLGPNVRAVYGRGEYLHGAIGSGKRFSHGTIFPHMQQLLETLFTLEFGASKDV
jgi:hypothetical protein